MAETDDHRILMTALIQALEHWFADQPKVHVSGNLLIYYVPGNNRKHVSPDVFVVKGIKKGNRLYDLTREERKNPSVVFEVTSKSTRAKDIKTKYALYRDVLKVKEYFPFDLVDGRMPSEILDIHLESAGEDLRRYDPITGRHFRSPEERAAVAKQRAVLAKRERNELAAELQRSRRANGQSPRNGA